MACLQCRQTAFRAPSTSSAFVGSSIPRAPLRASSRPAARQVTRMGLFGLGLPELAVIAGVAALIFGEYPAATRNGGGGDGRRPGGSGGGRRPPGWRAPSWRSRLLSDRLVVLTGAACVTQLYAGPSKLPEIGKGLGQTVKSFQSAAKVGGGGGGGALVCMSWRMSCCGRSALQRHCSGI